MEYRYVHGPYTGKHKITGIPATYRGHPVVEGTIRGRRGGRRVYGTIRDRTIDLRRSSAKPPENKILVKDKMGTKIYMYKKKSKKPKQRGIVRRYIPATLAPKRKLVRMKTSINATLQCTDGVIDKMSINMFNFQDPFSAFSTQQPLGFDQWKTLYNSAVVVGLKVVARIHNRSAVAIITGITACNETQGTGTLTNSNHYQETKGTKSRLLSPDVDHLTMFHKVGTKRHIGVKNLMDEDEFHCLDLANETAPQRTSYFHLWAQPIDQTTSLIDASSNSPQVNVTAEYIILLHDQIIPTTRPTHT